LTKKENKRSCICVAINPWI